MYKLLFKFLLVIILIIFFSKIQKIKNNLFSYNNVWRI